MRSSFLPKGKKNGLLFGFLARKDVYLQTKYLIYNIHPLVVDELKPLHVVFFVDKNLEKAKYTLKHLACRLAVEPVWVHAFLRNGRDSFGRIMDRKMVGKLAEVRQYLQQTKLTFAFVKTVGGLTFEEVCNDKSKQTCIDAFMNKLREKEDNPRLVWLQDDLWHDPWNSPS